MGNEYWAVVRSMEMKHYGVLGMKWGVHRTPEQLGHKIGARRKPRSQLEARSSTVRVVAEGMRERMSISKIKDQISISRKINNRINNVIKERRKYEKYDPDTGLYIKNVKMSKIQDMREVNPYGDVLDAEILGASDNCMLCTTTYELRRRGYDAIANLDKVGFGLKDLKSWFKNPIINSFAHSVKDATVDPKVFTPQKRKAFLDEVVQKISNEPDGSRGNFMVYYTGEYAYGHSMAYEIENGKPVIYDCQTKEVFRDIRRMLLKDKVCVAYYTRTDNLELRKKNIKEVAT